jgi:hypothetical protein
VAQEAGVSTQTVSRVINERPDVGPEKLTDEEVHGLRRWVRNGGGLLAAHAAICIADSSPALGTLFGGVFVSHPEPFTFSIYPLSGEHPITADIQAFEIHDEFYIQKYSPSVEIHMTAIYQDVAYPMVWSRREGKGRVRAMPFTYCRVSTDDFGGKVMAYLGEGELTNDPLKTFGGYGVVKVPQLQKLLAYICENGFEHHTAINLAQCAAPVNEAFTRYLGWNVYYHK